MADEYIKRSDAINAVRKWAKEHIVISFIKSIPAADVVEIPETGIGDLSDGYHTFNGLYYQRMVLFNALVNAYNGRAWKSWKHEDGEPCFGGGWFIVGIDTPKGSYTYHYEDKYWNWFECEELPIAKRDVHTEEDITRLLTLPDVAEVKHGEWVPYEFGDYHWHKCSICGKADQHIITVTRNVNGEYKSSDMESVRNYCPNCGARMDGE